MDSITEAYRIFYIPSGGSTKVYTRLVYMKSISDFMASNHFLESILNI